MSSGNIDILRNKKGRIWIVVITLYSMFRSLSVILLLPLFIFIYS
jgi:hypothetical protein